MAVLAIGLGPLVAVSCGQIRWNDEQHSTAVPILSRSFAEGHWRAPCALALRANADSGRGKCRKIHFDDAWGKTQIADEYHGNLR